MKQAIGIIDSGVGGLTVVKEIMRQLPNESVIYLGDNARCPYGPRTKEEVQQFTWELTKFLLKKKIKMLIIACNTATAVALEEIKQALPIPVLGVIQPGARAAIKHSKQLRIGVIGTEGTVRSRAYAAALHDINEQVHVTSIACPKFVPVVESGEYNSALAKKVVAESLQPLKITGIDTIILGCTHYPLLGPIIASTMGKHVKVISSGDETARETSVILEYQGLLNKHAEKPVHHFYTTGSKEIFKRIATSWLGSCVENVSAIKLDEH
ncbi:glutamate racemase [Bacillus sp. AGMB 02131]|uniref:Glutamate racemase n=1 Tax=Peribacillus faecalis TaxID=2772559 RepID=A0A927CVQ2_9BACI|nr:glutamate racemase [Peribacillus faecalis]MBD3108391.1 glutamate racemase [Peribacillus faecalis]